MNWKEILKFDDLSNMRLGQFGDRVIAALETLGFEIQYSKQYPTSTKGYTPNQLKRMKFRQYTKLTEEELMDYDGSGGQHLFGHELVITDMEPPFVGDVGYGTDTMTIKYLPDHYETYYTPNNPDAPTMAVSSWKVESVGMTTKGAKKKKIDVKLDLESLDNSTGGVRSLVAAISKAFEKYAQYEDDWGDMTDEEQANFRGEMAGHRFSGAARSLGYRDR